MKLLFNENLSPRLVGLLSTDFAGSCHVQDVQLNATTDAEIWDFARTNGFTLISKDSDFYDRSVLLGSPPKVIWLRVGNCSTQSIAELLATAQHAIRQFIIEDREACLWLAFRPK